MKNPVATITLDDGRKMVLELYPDIAPNTVNNFIELANSGQYDGRTIHRIVKEFVIQKSIIHKAGNGDSIVRIIPYRKCIGPSEIDPDRLVNAPVASSHRVK